ncbi:MAG: magnesium/cobalt transporter CorA [Bacteroidaceae bacterium]|nr:magnesium/cobalt transporter CorA [Bacteroidaceae bacterium]
MRKQASVLHRKRKRTRNTLLMENLLYTGDKGIDTRIRLIQYNANEYFSTDVADVKALLSVLKDQYINWIQVSGMSDTDMIGDLGDLLGLHRLDIQDILTAQHVSKIEIYEDKTMLLFNSFSYKDKELQQEHICIVLGQNFVVSFQESSFPLFDNVLKAIEANTTKVRGRSADFLFGLLCNNVLSNYIETVAFLEDDLGDLEEELSTGNPEDEFSIRLQQKRHDYLQMRKSVIPLKENFNKLIFNDNGLVKGENLIYLSDLQDRLNFIVQSLEICHETMKSLMELYVSNNDMKMNEVMKRLTAVTTLFIPLTFVVGVWGMNFRFMPELDWKYGYLTAWIVMLLIAIAVGWYIRKKKWF